MTDIRDAVAKAIDDKLDWYDISPNAINEAADAALSVARPLIEAEARERALREAAALRDFADWVDTWVSNPAGSYSVYALDGLFGMARDRLALIPAPAQEPAHERNDA